MPGQTYFETNDAVDRLYLVSQSVITKVSVFQGWLNGTLTAGKTVGFNYAFDYLGNHYDFPFRHTIVAGDTVQSVFDDLLAQLKLCDTARAAIGSDIFQHGVVVQDGGRYTLAFNQSWPFVVNGAPSITAYNESGSGITVQAVVGDNTFEVNPFIVFARNPRATSGREPQKGDQIGSLIFVTDVTGGNASIYDDAPFYAQQIVSIEDPSPDKHTARVDYTAAFHDFHGVVRNLTRELAPARKTKDNFVREVPYSLLNIGATNWTTIATVKPVVNSSVDAIARVEIDMQATMTDGTGGSLRKRSEIRINAGVVTASWNPANSSTMGDTWTVGSGSARLNVVGNDIQVQVMAPAGKSIESGLAVCRYILPADITRSLQWSIE